MKHKHIFILAMALLPWSLQAQLTGWMGYIHDNTPYINDASIVRTADDNHVVVKYTHNGNDSLARISIHQFFTASPGSSIVPPMTAISVPNGLRISDMRALHDTVFFCGQYTPYGFDAVAAYGYVVLDTSFASVSFNIFHGDYAFTLERMVVYPKGGDYRIIAIGEDKSLTRQCIVQADDIISTSSPFSTTTPPLNYAYLHNIVDPQIEQLDDIALTEQFVVFVGRDLRMSPGCLYVRYADRGLGIKSPFLQNTYRLLPDEPSIEGTVHATAMTDDQIAIGYLSDELSGDDRLAYLTSLQILPTSIQPLAYQTTIVSGDGSISELAYMPTPRSVVMLWPTMHASTTAYTPGSRYLLWMPDIFGQYPALQMCTHRRIAFSIDHCRTDAFVSWGSLGLILRHISDNPCFVQDYITIEATPIEGVFPIEEPLVITNHAPAISGASSNEISLTIIPFCTH